MSARETRCDWSIFVREAWTWHSVSRLRRGASLGARSGGRRDGSKSSMRVAALIRVPVANEDGGLSSLSCAR